MNLFSLEKSSSKVSSLSCFEIFLSRDFIYRRLRSFGFIHKIKNRPVSNSKYLFLSDANIIKIFGFYATSFLNWFSCVLNISDIKYTIELLRQSCFLTLCRKHNKRKAWALDVFTSDLLIVENLCFSYLVFPRKSFILNFKRNFSFYHSQLFFNENFFL
uniref:Maturase-like protein 2 n=1 Tax=Euglena mutabilis TaxID=38275 RepID=A0A1B0UL19_EUGMU|nr:maturase-like protein 2 [Euglena mutabilis]